MSEDNLKNQIKPDDGDKDIEIELDERRNIFEVTKSHIPKLIEFVYSDDEEKRKRSSRALVEVAKEHPNELEAYVAEIVNLLDDDDADVRMHACFILGFIGSESALNELEETKEYDSSPEVQTAAKKAVANIEKQLEDDGSVGGSQGVTGTGTGTDTGTDTESETEVGTHEGAEMGGEKEPETDEGDEEEETAEVEGEGKEEDDGETSSGEDTQKEDKMATESEQTESETGKNETKEKVGRMARCFSKK
ncbi:MAG: HEAT repeat domain-containing protein [Halobacteria archaeon]|nr:HEAT repeat domain-containing protein [Halobacteria archaeon]